jgi:hypothetical protein
MGSYFVTQAGLKLLCSSDPPASASWEAGTTCMYHCASLPYKFLNQLISSSNNNQL